MKKRYIAVIIVLLVLVLGAITVKIVFNKLEGNLEQLTLSEIPDVDLSTANDGIYTGNFSAFPVSAEVEVSIKNHMIVDIELIKHNNGQGEGAEVIPQKVIENQTLNVDSISGATYSSKVILKAIHDAISKAYSN